MLKKGKAVTIKIKKDKDVIIYPKHVVTYNRKGEKYLFLRKKNGHGVQGTKRLRENRKNNINFKAKD